MNTKFYKLFDNGESRVFSSVYMGDMPVEATYLPQIRIKERGVEKAFDSISYAASNGVIFIDGPIAQGMANIVQANLIMISETRPGKEINIYINSPGGSVTEGLAIYDAMRYVDVPVNTVGTGMCASMGSFLLSAGIVTGKASILPNTTVMVHQVLSGYQGQSTDLDIHTDFTGKLKNKLSAYYVLFMLKALGYEKGKAGYDEAKEKFIKFVGDCFERDYFLDAEETLKYGLVNEIIYTEETLEESKDIDEISKSFDELRMRRKERGLEL